ncbi:MAG: hypothetical protein AAFP85_06090 [Pseudomonadota bacterium]
MKRWVMCFALLAACDGVAGAGPTGNEFMVIGGRMSFEDCRARGGLIIRDANTSMIACDPSVRGEPQPVDEFDNPANTG